MNVRLIDKLFIYLKLNFSILSLLFSCIFILNSIYIFNKDKEYKGVIRLNYSKTITYYDVKQLKNIFKEKKFSILESETSYKGAVIFTRDNSISKVSQKLNDMKIFILENRKQSDNLLLNKLSNKITILSIEITSVNLIKEVFITIISTISFFLIVLLFFIFKFIYNSKQTNNV